LIVFFLASDLRAQSVEQVDPNEPPIAGQPEFFTGAVGSYHLAMQARPTEVRAGDALTLTVRITADAMPQRPPRGPDLRRLPRFSERFHIERSSSDRPDRTLPDGQAWEFDYRLRPKSQAVMAVPNLRFDYYKPGFVPATKGYQTAWAYAIPLRVQAPEQVELSTGAEEPRAPEPIYQIVTGSAVLRRETAWGMPSPWVATGLALATPVGCAIWYGCWRRWYPDAARQAWQRRTRAARKALRALGGVRAASPNVAAEQAAAILTRYLQQRLDVRIAEFTAAEVAERLRRGGCPAEVTDRAAAFFRARDAARFAPHLPDGQSDGPDAVTQLILALEAEPWQSPAS
jgi:hypothetical protein